tara:strand:+ start:40 stop:438 length:399 start_codon:yes stop_codon:yes gene_type:complete
MNNKSFIKNLPKSFYQEEKILCSNNIKTWAYLSDLTDADIQKLVYKSLGSVRNLQKLKHIAYFICTLDIELHEAALLIHSGLITNKAISRLSPQELVQKTGRFERFLQSGRFPLIDLKKAKLLIEKAKKNII